MRLWARPSAGLLLGALFLGACGSGRETPTDSSPPEEPHERAAVPEPPPRPPVHYEPWHVDGATELSQKAAELGEDLFGLVLRVNRIDLAHVRKGETILIPRNAEGPLDVAPLPLESATLAAVPRLIAVSRSIQAFGAYEQGRLVRWGPTSTGREDTPTPAGLFFLNWKARQTRSTDNDAWLLKWYFNFHNRRGISFHEYDLPGMPASHACVRLLADDAEWLYRWGVQWLLSRDGTRVLAEGTPVVVFGEYDWEATSPPWTRLHEDPGKGRIPPEELAETLGSHLPDIEHAGRRRMEWFLSMVPLP